MTITMATRMDIPSNEVQSQYQSSCSKSTGGDIFMLLFMP